MSMSKFLTIEEGQAAMIAKMRAELEERDAKIDRLTNLHDRLNARQKTLQELIEAGFLDGDEVGP